MRPSLQMNPILCSKYLRSHNEVIIKLLQLFISVSVRTKDRKKKVNTFPGLQNVSFSLKCNKKCSLYNGLQNLDYSHTNRETHSQHCIFFLTYK